MDWSVLCHVEYISAMKGVEIAGVALAEFVEWLVSLGVSIDKVHLIGHSLGAHVAGVAGSKILNGKIGRITGKHGHNAFLCYYVHCALLDVVSNRIRSSGSRF